MSHNDSGNLLGYNDWENLKFLSEALNRESLLFHTMMTYNYEYKTSNTFDKYYFQKWHPREW